MKEKYGFTLYTLDEFKFYLKKTEFKRYIKRVQLHHTYEPSHADFHDNHFDLLRSMKNFHVNERKFSDIAQNITIFPDGMIAVCRPFDVEPAGIFGQNKGALCIEVLGNFDKEDLTEAQKIAVVGTVAALHNRFLIPLDTDGILYHHWFDLDTGKRKQGNNKSCPGVCFFGGNTEEDCRQYFISEILKVI